MHGHPFSGPIQLWWGKVWGTAEKGERPRNLFGSHATMPPRADMFRAGDLISRDGRIFENRHLIHTLMGRLTERTRRANRPTQNVGIPSGYTYLLQFIAHDLVDSTPSFTVRDRDLTPGASNARTRPLWLDTLYGSGAEECPLAYEFTPSQTEHGVIPRTYFRLGARAHPFQASDPYCPFRDIARLADPDRKFPDGRPMFTEAMLADPRNDAHALVSQLTVLFQILHNHVLQTIDDAMEAAPGADRLPSRERALRQFECARTVVALIYRNIIVKDVLRRILNDRIYDRYVVDKVPPIDSGDGIPLEFTFGAFRFGHAMVRESYAVNSTFTDQGTDGAIDRTSVLADTNRPVPLLPIGKIWLIDWARFFDNDKGIIPNASMSITPRYPIVLMDNSVVVPPKVPDFDAAGLMHRDLLSATFAGPLSVPALMRSMKEKGFEGIGEFDDWRERLRTWLSGPSSGGVFPPDDRNVDRLVNDPPLPFFVLFEASELGGKRLGPVGSVIVAETIFGAMRKHPLPVQGATLKDAIRKCVEVILGLPDPDQPLSPVSPFKALVTQALSDIDEIEEMPQLLRYMERAQVFARS